VSRRGEGLRRVEREIAGEKAAALGRAGERLEHALEEAQEAGARLLAAQDDGARRARCVQEYTAVRARVLQTRLALLIQREALGLRRHTTVDQLFPEPPTAEQLILGYRFQYCELRPSTSEQSGIRSRVDGGDRL
jgi:hypothetical protein